MKLYTTATPLDSKEGSFKNGEGETINYFQLQVEMQKEVKVGDQLKTETEYPFVSCTKEVFEAVEINKPATFEVVPSYDNKNRSMKYRFVSIVKKS